MHAMLAAICFLLVAILPGGEQQLIPSSLNTNPGVSELSPEDCPSPSIRNGDRDSNTCKEMFTSLGPFCSMVVVMDGNVQRCVGDYAGETCSFCLSLQQKCGSLVGSVSDICTSRNARMCSFLRSSCSSGRNSGPDCDYCEAVFTSCKQLTRVPPTAMAIVEPSFCSMTFDSIGPFCQYVLHPNNDDEECQAGFSTSTCSTCRNVLQSCNHSLVGGTEDICMSNLAFSCAFLQSDSTTFLVEYCSVVQALCSEQLSGSAKSSGSLSGSGVGSGSGVSGSGTVSGSGSALPMSGSGSGDQCQFVRNTFGQLCTAVLQSPTCESVYSKETCNLCQLAASMCAPLDSNNIELFCEQPFFDCETIVDNCILGTESSFQCDYCAFYANNCFGGRELELCDIKSLLNGCNRAIGTGYPCECFFTVEICTLCNNLQLICPPNVTTPTGPTQSTTPEPTTVSESTLPVSSTTEENTTTDETTNTEPATITESSTTTPPTTTVVQSSTMLNFTTTAIPPFTTPQDVPVVTLVLEDLTMAQQDNAITTVFGGLEVDQFLENGIIIFREQIASLVNTYEGTGTQRRKRQQTQVSPNDVLLIGSPVMIDNELLIAFVVVGQNGEPVNGQILTTIVNDGGSQLASVLSIATGVSVEFIGATEGIDSTILQPLTTTSVTTSVLEESSELPNGAIVAIVLIVVLVLVLSIVFVIIILLVRQRSRRKKYNLDIAGSPKTTNIYQTTDKLGVPLAEDEEPLHQSDVCLQEKSEPLTVPPTVYIESNPTAVEDDQKVQESDDTAKDTSI